MPTGYCVIGGQKVPLERPRVGDVRNREVPLGSYEVLQQASLMEDAVWNKIMHGLTTRCYGEVVRELEAALRNCRRVLWARHAFCAITIGGTCFADQEVVVAIGLTLQGRKKILGLHQGATENATAVKHLLNDLGRRGVAFDAPRLHVLDGAKAPHAAVRKVAGKCAQIQRCQVHKIRNVVDYLTEDYQLATRCKMRNAYSMLDHGDAKRAPDALLQDWMHLNPSAARSLEEGMEETIAMHRLRVPEKLRRNLSSTNMIESAFSTGLPQRQSLAGRRSIPSLGG